MKQYCRYCANLCMGDAVYCNHKGITMSEKSIYRPNTCKYYDYCGLDENNYAIETIESYRVNLRERGYDVAETYDEMKIKIETAMESE